ncbi:CdaR family transcriptional regulator [Alkalihalobacterium chitinilyticum]|uniref:Helix-turn-helix domain-containing protein n=1 Tax=Alkalihalobacterium chitinilyticum TaxID=2980103 RepID=A0ABT5VEE1_9BACI|nr:sugar diacid recognition domain-containing protein [Alkalihalobacterium chitinilyticum]MDE5413828.1 helix-turn-helix domain-containing protein [Alkalihalobacterium chitinilyticum]
MKLLSLLAQRIVNEVTKVIDEEVIVINKEGIIIAASDSHRVGHLHEGALRVFRSKQKMEITDADVHSLEGVKAGLNLPIFFQHDVIGVIGITGDPQTVSPFGELIQRMTELIIQEAHSAEKLNSEIRGIETFVYEWIHNREFDEDFHERGELLGLDMDLSRMCVLINLKSMNNADLHLVEKETEERLRLLFSDPAIHTIVRAGQGRVLLLKGLKHQKDEINFLKQLKTMRKQLEQLTQTTIFVGVGTRQSPDLVLKSYSEAKKALQTASDADPVVLYEQLTLEGVLAEISVDMKLEVAEKVLGNMTEDPELMDTLETYFYYHMSLKDTAEHLHIHINTLHYRLKRIHERLGGNLKDPKFLATCYIAYIFWKETRETYNNT